MGLAKTTAQFRCNKSVSLKYFKSITELCSEEVLRSKLSLLLEDLPDDEVYVGVTHHPCSRFAGNKAGTTPLPAPLDNISYTSENALIDERLHYLDYDMMYLICCTNHRASIFFNETKAIEIVKELDPDRVVHNDTKGGNGNIPKSQYYWLYICTKTKQILS